MVADSYLVRVLATRRELHDTLVHVLPTTEGNWLTEPPARFLGA